MAALVAYFFMGLVSDVWPTLFRTFVRGFSVKQLFRYLAHLWVRSPISWPPLFITAFRDFADSVDLKLA